MNAAEARALLFQNKLGYIDYEDSIPGIPQLDGLLGIIELPANEGLQISKQSTDANGDADQSLILAGQVVKSLVMRDTKDRVFTDTDVQGVAGFGLSVLLPINKKIEALSGLNTDAVDAAKKN